MGSLTTSSFAISAPVQGLRDGWFAQLSLMRATRLLFGCRTPKTRGLETSPLVRVSSGTLVRRETNGFPFATLRSNRSLKGSFAFSAHIHTSLIPIHPTYNFQSRQAFGLSFSSRCDHRLPSCLRRMAWFLEIFHSSCLSTMSPTATDATDCVSINLPHSAQADK